MSLNSCGLTQLCRCAWMNFCHSNSRNEESGSDPVERARQLGEKLEEIGAAHLIDRQLGELSGGEFQRILIAYALLDNPDLLLLDEPMTGLDVRGGMSFDGLLHHLNEHVGITIVMVSHDLHLVEHLSDQVLCINRTVHCHGSPDQVLQPDNLSKAYGHLPGLVSGHGIEAFIPIGKLK